MKTRKYVWEREAILVLVSFVEMWNQIPKHVEPVLPSERACISQRSWNSLATLRAVMRTVTVYIMANFTEPVATRWASDVYTVCVVVFIALLPLMEAMAVQRKEPTVFFPPSSLSFAVNPAHNVPLTNSLTSVAICTDQHLFRDGSGWPVSASTNIFEPSPSYTVASVLFTRHRSIDLGNKKAVELTRPAI